jgi:diguanylate cyclase (GGDEF)-like protein/PAS domain S-box-containing protein
MKQEMGWLTLKVGGPALALVGFLTVATVADTLLMITLTPWMGAATRTCTGLLVVAAALRAGIKGGLAAAVIGVFMNISITYLIYGPTDLTNELWSRALPNAFFNAIVGVLVGRTYVLGRKLKLELSERERIEILLRESEECYRMLFASNPHPMWVSEIETFRFLAVNEAAVQYYGFSVDEFSAMTIDDLAQPCDAHHMSGSLSRSLPRYGRVLDCKHRKKDGTVIDVEIVTHQVTFQGREARLVLANDVSEVKRAHATLEHLALHDPLTDLPNRSLLQKYLEQSIASARRTHVSFALMLVDLDRFKDINDTLGHPYGDLVLQQINPRFRTVLRESDVLARLGGDEFAIILPEADETGAIQAAERLLVTMKEPFVLEGEEFDVGASIGIAIYTQHGEDASTLLRDADVAMYAAKRGGGGHVVYNPNCNQYAPHRLAVAGDLRHRIEGNQSLLRYQAKLDLRA